MTTNTAWTTSLLIPAAAIFCSLAAVDAQDPRLTSIGSITNTAKKRLETAYASAAARKKRSHSIAIHGQRQSEKSAKWAFDTAVHDADKWLAGAYRSAGHKLNDALRKIQATRRPGQLAIDRTCSQAYSKIESDRQRAHRTYKGVADSVYSKAESDMNRAYSTADRMWSDVQRRGRTDRQNADRVANQHYRAASNRYNQAKAYATRTYNAARQSNYQRAGRMPANVRVGWHARANRTAYQAMQRSIAAAKKAMDAAVSSARTTRTNAYNGFVRRERTIQERRSTARRQAFATRQTLRKNAYSRWQAQARGADANAKRLRTNALNRSIVAKKNLEAEIARKVAAAKRATEHANRKSKGQADSAKREAKLAHDQKVRAAKATASTAMRKADGQERRERKVAYETYVRTVGSRG